MPEHAMSESQLFGLEKRVLPNPTDNAAYVAGLKPTWISQVGLTAGTWFDFGASNVQAAGVNGIYGCTSVFVVSQKGVYISHTWVSVPKRLERAHVGMVAPRRHFKALLLQSDVVYIPRRPRLILRFHALGGPSLHH